MSRVGELSASGGGATRPAAGVELVTLDVVIYAGDALFCTTLPAFLRYLLHERESLNDLPFQLAGQLTRRTDVDNKKLERRLSRLTTAQRAVVGEMLAYLATVAPMDEIMGRALATWDKGGE